MKLSDYGFIALTRAIYQSIHEGSAHTFEPEHLINLIDGLNDPYLKEAFKKVVN